MAKQYGKCYEARKPSPVKTWVQELPSKEGQNLRILEDVLCSLFKFYSKKQLRRMYRIKLDSEYNCKAGFKKKRISVGKGFNEHPADLIRKEELVL